MSVVKEKTSVLSILFVSILLNPIVCVNAMGFGEAHEEFISKVLEYYAKVPKEKIYVQTDRNCYAAGDTIWFRAYMVDAASNKPASRSKFVYMELHDIKADSLVKRVLVRNDEDGVFANAIALPYGMASGYYILIAYTQWMRNFDVQNFYSKPLAVIGKEKMPFAAKLRRTTATAYSQDTLIHVGQRKGAYLLRATPCKNTDSLAFVIYGSGNLLEIPYSYPRIVQVEKDLLRPGTVEVALVDKSSQRIMAERPMYIRDDNREDFDVAVTNSEGQATITISAKDKTAVQGTYAVSVTNAKDSVLDLQTCNLEDYLLEESERPARYRLSDIIEEKVPVMQYDFQTSQVITGHIDNTTRKRDKVFYTIYTPTTGKMHTLLPQDEDKSKFAIEVDCQDTDGVLLKVNNQYKVPFRFKIDESTFPAVYPILEKWKQELSSTRDSAGSYSLSDDFLRNSIMLGEVVKTGRKRPKQINNRREAPSFIITSDDPRLKIVQDLNILLRMIGVQARNRRVFITGDSGRIRVRDITPSEIEQIDFYKGSRKLGTVGLSSRRTQPDVVYIKLKKGAIKRIYGSAEFHYLEPLGYSAPQKWHTPDALTYYWNAKMRFDQKGQIKIVLSSKAIKDDLLLKIEGISDEGKILSREIGIKLK